MYSSSNDKTLSKVEKALLSRPHSNEYWIVFPLDPEKKQYTYSDYSPAMLQGRVPAESVEKVISEINKFIAAKWSKNRNLIKFIIGTFILAILAFTASILLIIFGSLNYPSSSFYLYMFGAGTLIAIGVIILVAIVIYSQ